MRIAMFFFIHPKMKLISGKIMEKYNRNVYV